MDAQCSIVKFGRQGHWLVVAPGGQWSAWKCTQRSCASWLVPYMRLTSFISWRTTRARGAMQWLTPTRSPHWTMWTLKCASSHSGKCSTRSVVSLCFCAQYNCGHNRLSCPRSADTALKPYHTIPIQLCTPSGSPVINTEWTRCIFELVFRQIMINLLAIPLTELCHFPFCSRTPCYVWYVVAFFLAKGVGAYQHLIHASPAPVWLMVFWWKAQVQPHAHREVSAVHLPYLFPYYNSDQLFDVAGKSTGTGTCWGTPTMRDSGGCSWALWSTTTASFCRILSRILLEWLWMYIWWYGNVRGIFDARTGAWCAGREPVCEWCPVLVWCQVSNLIIKLTCMLSVCCFRIRSWIDKYDYARIRMWFLNASGYWSFIKCLYSYLIYHHSPLCVLAV